MLGVQARPQAGQDLAQQAIPDAPKPQATLPNLNSVAPGMGTTSTSSGDEPSGPSANTPQPASSKVVTTPPTPAELAQPGNDQSVAYEPVAGEGVNVNTVLHVRVNYVDIDFTVKDSKGRLVPGLTGRDVEVFE